MFLTIIGNNECYVVIKRRFQHSLQMVHKHFHEVLEATMKFAKEMIAPTTFDSNMNIPSAHNKRGRRKGKCYQNVLEICDFNMVFTYVYAGYEGVAHDARVLTEVVSNLNNGFLFPPFRDYRHRRIITKEEKFNHAYAQLINVIEHSYGVLKARFPILDKMAPYPINIQRDVVIAYFAVNNLIRNERINNELFNQFDISQVIFDEEGQQEEIFEETNGPSWTVKDSKIMHNMQEELTLKLMH
ncbi:uncharacterized protein LOC124887094 [Capsicum annuum]|uniref:uncharacterized protein LOC124887094 n=1 Tax=Capsicum annuum TaxID=4072 RepID=UPI001FB0B81B|nr:uncharacterized protein LOC124887094 [Capsicum annuum]